MDGRIVDGNRWIADRLAFLRQRLGDELGEDERRAIEAEIAALSKERCLPPGGMRTGRVVRWLQRRR